MDKDIKKLIKETDKMMTLLKLPKTQVALILTALSSYKDIIQMEAKRAKKAGEKVDKTTKEHISYFSKLLDTTINDIINQVTDDKEQRKVLMDIAKE